MQLKIAQLALLSCSILVMTSCKKDNSGPSGPPKIKSRTYTVDVTNYTYDGSNRIIMAEHTHGGQNTGKEVYDYSTTGKVLVNYYSSAGALNGTETYELDDRGLAVSESSSGNPSFHMAFTYNDARQLLSSIETMTSNNTQLRYESNLHYTNGNLDSTMFTQYSDGNVTSTSVRYYDAYITDSLNTTGNVNTGAAFLGLGSKNLLRTMRDPSASPSNSIINFVYEYDPQGRVTKSTGYYANSAVYAYPPSTYTYY